MTSAAAEPRDEALEAARWDLQPLVNGEGDDGVSQEEVFALFRHNLERLTGLLTDTVAALPAPDGCTCSSWADSIELTYEIPAE